MGVRKGFDREVYDAVNIPACEAVIDYLATQGLYVKYNKDQYGIDLIVYEGYTPASYIEVEVKRVWKNHQDAFPWAQINLPERKGRYMGKRKPVEFWILREDLLKAIVIPISVLKDSPLEEVPNKYIANGEYFYKIDISKCTIVDLHTGEEK